MPDIMFNLMDKIEAKLPEGYNLRPLQLDDFSKGYLDCLAQLTIVGEISQESFTERFNYLKSNSDSYHAHVITDASGKIVAAGTLIIERKFIRNLGSCGHIEDIVVDAAQRGMNLGKILLQYLKELAGQVGCYKVILDCEGEKVQFYEKCGFKEKGRQMAHYF